MSDNSNIRRPQFIHFFQPVIDALLELGGSGQPSEVKEIIADKLKIPEDKQGTNYKWQTKNLLSVSRRFLFA